MPHLQRRMRPVPLGYAAYERGAFTPVVSVIRAIVLARAVTEVPAVACHRQHLRVKPAHPRRRRGGGNGEGSREFLFGQQNHYAVQLIEEGWVRLRFKDSAREDIYVKHG